MAKIVAAQAWCNNEVAYLAWKTDAKIKDCLGFMITRIHLDAQGNEVERRLLPSWAPFKTQSNPDWVERDTSIWPIQKFTWRDLTLRRSRDSLAVRDAGFTVKYEIVPVGKAAPDRPPVPPSPMPQPGSYRGTPVPLFICGDAFLTNEINVTTTVIGSAQNPVVTAGFTNGILSTQNLRQQLQVKPGQAPTKKQLEPHIRTAAPDPIRRFLSGDALTLIRAYMARANSENCDLYMALYELNDPELIALIEENKARVHLILSTAGSSKPRKGSGEKPTWDTTNTDSRAELRDQVAEFHDRMFNNSAHIGHNKFAVLVERDSGTAKAVLTGSTNWTFTGLCTQSNNVIIIDDETVAAAYLAYWEHLRADDQSVPVDELQLPNNHAQGADLRNEDMTPSKESIDGNHADVRIWYSPNTISKTKKDVTPPDLKVVFDLMDHAEKAIFFLTFKPSLGGDKSIISEAINAAVARPAQDALLVLGAISDGTALPGGDSQAGAKRAKSKSGKAAKARKRGTAKATKKKTPPKHKSRKRKTVAMARRASVLKSAKPRSSKAKRGGKSKAPQPKRAIYTNPKAPKVLMIRAAAISDFDLIGDWEHELLRYGQAIIHDKIVVIDPLSDNCAVITGSHNLGYKASYANDENMLIIRGNKALAAAYAVHVLDIYDHYRFRAILEDRAAKGIKPQRGHGILEADDSWQDDYFNGKKGQEREYFLGG